MPTTAEISALGEKYVSHFNGCVKDSDRMASLMLLGKLLKHENCSDEVKRAALRRMDLTFVGRMLNSKSTVTNEDGTSASLQEVAVSILQHWACDPELMVSEGYLRLLRPLGRIITAPSHVEEEDGAVASSACIADVYLCLRCMMEDVGGRVALLENGVVPFLCRAVVSACRDHEKAVDILKWFSQCHEGVLWDLCGPDMHQVLSRLADNLAGNESSALFVRLDNVRHLLRGLDVSTETPPEWLESLSTALLGALKSKIDAVQRRTLLLLAAELSRLWEFAWLLPHAPQDLFLLVQVAAIETGVLVEYSVSPDKTLAHADLLVACFALLEAAVRWLSSENGPPAPDFMARLIGPLGDAFAALGRMLVRWAADPGSLEACWGSREATLFLCAAVRTLGVWLAQDEWPGTEAERISEELLVALHSLGSQSFDSAAQDDEEGVDIVRFLLPALCLTSAEAEQRQRLIRVGWPDLIVRYVVHRLEHVEASSSAHWEDAQAAVSSAVNVLLNFLLERRWLAEVGPLVQLVTARWQVLSAISHHSLVLHLVLFLTSVLALEEGKNQISDRCVLALFEALLGVLERCGQSYRRSAAVWKEWDDLEGLWLLSMQILTDAVEKRRELVDLVARSGISQSVDNIVQALDVGDVCYKPLAGMKSVLIMHS